MASTQKRCNQPTNKHRICNPRVSATQTLDGSQGGQASNPTEAAAATPKAKKNKKAPLYLPGCVSVKGFSWEAGSQL